jgi:hypothetical protein
MHCGTHYTCGDCITHTCPECDDAGHRGWTLDCPVCQREAEQRRFQRELVRMQAATKGRPFGDGLGMEG